MWLLVSIAAQFIAGSSAVFDKLLLKKSYPNPFGYAFWLGMLGLTGLALVPFGFEALPLIPLVVALGAGILLTIAMVLYYVAIARGELSNAAILIGALSPIFTLGASEWILGVRLSAAEIVAFMLLTAGGAILFLAEKSMRRSLLVPIALGSALAFGISNTLTKSVFLETNFVTGFVWIKIGAAAASLLLLLHPQTRANILHFRADGKSGPKRKLIDNLWRHRFYLINRGYAGLGAVLVSYALFLGIPPLVDATINFKYVFIVIGGWLILKERFRGWVLAAKLAALTLIAFGTAFLGTADYLKSTAPDPNRPITWGVTFSQKFAGSLSLDWKETYDAILEDLGAEHLRLIAYWDLVEREPGVFRFDDLDYQMRRAEEAGASVILAIGKKVPRWPECHIPGWAASQKPRDQDETLLRYLGEVVTRYRGNPSLIAWQVENEPFLDFGECEEIEERVLDQEIALVRSLDPAHPALLTDSGEVSLWYAAAKRGDIFGMTMYRRVYHNRFGAVDYHLPPEFFRLKEKAVRFMTGNRTQKFIVVELAAEPWLDRQLYETTPEEQLRSFDPAFMKDTIRYAIASGFDEHYLWGAEWWWWMKTKHHNSEFWEFAKTVIQKRN